MLPIVFTWNNQVMQFPLIPFSVAQKCEIVIEANANSANASTLIFGPTPSVREG